ncbi:MAG: hypothetical protein OEV64_09935 [Desulfobulbaceae bacterium]|nr:hypothetical protein [Desulfobulbaceae bacterium]
MIILAVVFLFELVIFQTILPKETKWVEFVGDSFSCLVPEGEQKGTWFQDGWEKSRFYGTVGDLYVSSRPLDGSALEALAYFEQYITPIFSREIEVIGPGKFYIQPFGKGRRYIYLFVAGDRLFWLENTKGSSSLRFYKKILDKVVESLKVDGQGVSTEFGGAVREIDQQIGLHSQTETMLLAFMLGLPLTIICLIALPMIVFIGRLPEFVVEKPERAEANLFAWVRTPMRFQGTLVSVALFKDRLVVYSWRRPLLVISRNEGSIERVAGKNKIEVASANRRVIIDLPNYAHWLADMPGRQFSGN